MAFSLGQSSSSSQQSLIDFRDRLSRDAAVALANKAHFRPPFLAHSLRSRIFQVEKS